MITSDQALVFDIKRFAVHDGSGIRTTVFFKGCPLRCRWCHNPEGLDAQPRPMYLPNRCIHCGCCAKAAEENQLRFEEGTPVLNYDYPGSWDAVIQACPANAIVCDSKWYDRESLMKRIREDRVFFRDSGGVTFSGGEPLLHAAFLKEVMKACQSEGIHTAVETSLSVPQKSLAAVFPYCDEIFADIKLFESAEHREFTGVGNEQILANIRVLLSSEKKDAVTIRTPLIPGITANVNNIRRIADYIGRLCPGVKYELLNCNPLAGAKYAMSGKRFSLEGKLRRFSEEEMDEFCRAAAEGNDIVLIRERKAEER